ncbi:unnamed protein product [Cuscuta epithymum]|uniref:Uncharacterized protein n=1 Tax=Cuscuta epithymum TaxID=186058 RepID=A0AAV0DH39_9ASTE|nr:unnamed protein product [Cuscuta epithymum]
MIGVLKFPGSRGLVVQRTGRNLKWPVLKTTSTQLWEFGWVARDVASRFVGAGANSWSGTCSVKEAEPIRIRESLKWLKENDWDYVVEKGEDMSSLGLIVDDIKVFMRAFRSVLINFVQQSANRVTHELA